MSPVRRVVLCALAAAMVLSLAAHATASNPATDSRLSDESQKLWVFFTDKGLTRAEESAAIQAFRAALPERALERRAKVGFDVNWNDLPVSPAHVDAVAASGAEIVTKSRWLNAKLSD